MSLPTKKDSAYPPGLYLIPFVLLVLVYLPTLRDLISDWQGDSNYSHGFLVPVVSAYLLWSRRRELAAIKAKPSNSGLLLVLGGMVLFLMGSAGAEYFTARVSFVLTLFGLVWYLFGNRVASVSWFAFFFLCFMIPIPKVIYYSIAFPLQVLVSKCTVGLLQVLGMAIVRQGNIIHLSGGLSLEVADACSGMRSVTALLALGAIYAYWSQKRLTAQILLFLSAVPMAVLANVIRVSVTALLAVSITTDVSAEPLHSILGLSVFFISFAGLFIFGLILKRVFP
jgi:exosortase